MKIRMDVNKCQEDLPPSPSVRGKVESGRDFLKYVGTVPILRKKRLRVLNTCDNSLQIL